MTNLGFLKRRIIRGLVRDDIDPEELSGWVASATARISQDLRVREMISHASIPLTKNNYSLPPDFISVSSIGINKIGSFPKGLTPLIYVSPDQYDTECKNPFLQKPGSYTIKGTNIYVSKFSISGYEIDMYYFKKLPELLNDTDTSFALTNFPDLYFNTAMIYGHQFYLEYDMADKRENRIMLEIDRLNSKYKDEKYGDGPLVVPPARKLGGRFS